MVIYAGIDYGEILERAEREADVIVWDGGNNDFPFIEPDLFVVKRQISWSSWASVVGRSK